MDLELFKNLEKNIDIAKETNLFSKVVENVVEKGAVYVIKALPIQENVQDILVDVTKVLKTKSFSKVVQTAVTSSIREGMEMLGTPISILKDVRKITNVAKKGGLKAALCTSLDITFEKYIKNNLLSDIIDDFKTNIKEFINSKEFDRKLNMNVEKVAVKQDAVKQIIKDWKESYEEFNIEKLDSNYAKLNELSLFINRDGSLKYDVNFINNAMKLIHNNENKLTPIQIEFCKTV